MKKIFILIFYFSLFLPLISQQFTSKAENSSKSSQQKKDDSELYELSSTTADFSKVLTGKVIFEPVKLADSIVLITDARTLTCIKDDGKILWEKNLRNPSEAKVYKLVNDFIAVIVQNDTQLFILNQSGIQICHKIFDSKITGAPLCGFDSRIYVPFEDKIACFSIKGSQKWEIKNKMKATTLYSFNDGSICTVDSQPQTTTVKRYSPFGEEIDELVLPKSTIKVYQLEKGLLFTYKNQAPSFISLNDSKKMEEKWIYLKISKNPLPSDLNYERTGCLFADSDSLIFYYQYKRNIVFNKINVNDGELLSFFEIDGEDSFYNYHFNCNQNGYFIINSKNAAFLDNSGTLAWKKNLSTNPEEKILFYTFTPENDLILCSESWSINYFSVHKPIKKEKQFQNESEIATLTKNYSNFYSRKVYNPFYFNENSQTSLISAIEKQNYGIEEKTYFTNLVYYFNDYFDSLNSSSFGLTDNTANHEKNVNITSSAITVALALESSEFNQTIVSILEKEKNQTILKTTLSGISKYGYDPDFLLLCQLEKLSKKINSKNENLVPYICDATYAICECMGTKAFESYGNQIIKNFLQSKYNDKTKEKARSTYVKISKIFKN